MIHIVLFEAQYAELIDALDWAITASESDMGEPSNYPDSDETPNNAFQNLLSYINAHHKEIPQNATI